MRVPREKFSEVVQTWQKLPQSMRKCPNCGRILSGPVRDAWEDNKEEAWAYTTCPRCGDITLWKVARRWENRDAGNPVRTPEEVTKR